MDFELINNLKQKFAEDNDTLSALNQLETGVKALAENKENAVGEVKKLEEVKHNMAELLGLEKDIPANDLINNAKTKLQEYEQKVESFKKNASSKELENAEFQEKFSEMSRKLNEITERYEKEQAKNTLNEIKDNFRTALSGAGIRNPEAQEVAIDAYLRQAQGAEDLSQLAKSIAEAKPFLTDSIHKGGANTMPPNGINQNKNNLGSVPINDTKARTQIIAERLASRGLQ